MEIEMAAKLVLSQEIESPFCVSNADGVMVHDRIAEAFKRSEAIEISFSGVTRLTTAFLNAAIGQLYDEFPEKTISSLLQYTDATSSHLSKVKTTIDNAKIFFNDSKNLGYISREVGRDNEK